MGSKEQTKAEPPMQGNQSTNKDTNLNWRKIIVSIIIGLITGLLFIIIANFGMSIYKHYFPPKVPPNIEMAAPLKVPQNIEMAAPQASSPAIKPPPKKIAESCIKKIFQKLI
jgi:hypothetical protein